MAGEYVEEDEDVTDDEDDGQQLMLQAMRDAYPQKKCDAVGGNADTDYFYLFLYQDLKEKTYSAKLDMTGAKLVRGWLEAWITKNEKHLAGYE